VQLNRGMRPLVETTSTDKMEIVLQEIMQDKIFLNASNEMAVVGEQDGGDMLDMDSLEL
jgi:DNA-directed RNA polymerase subunit omega